MSTATQTYSRNPEELDDRFTSDFEDIEYFEDIESDDTDEVDYDPNPATEPEFKGHENISPEELDDMMGELA